MKPFARMNVIPPRRDLLKWDWTEEKKKRPKSVDTVGRMRAPQNNLVEEMGSE